MPEDVQLRPPTPADLARCAAICFDAFGGINARHGFPSDMPAPEVAAGLMGLVFNAPNVTGVVAEEGGRVVGSNFLWENGTVAGVGPVTVDPAAQGHSVGRRMMEHVLAHARARGFAGVRLVQAAFNTRSMSLYAKLGFDVREPLVCLQGDAATQALPALAVRRATEADVSVCADVCFRVHGHDRTAELHFGLQQGTATVVERGGNIVGYAADIGFFGHAVALDDAALMALIGATERISGPGFLLPSRNGEVFRWCLSRGLHVVQPMTLMTHGLYNEPQGAFLPSILY